MKGRTTSTTAATLLLAVSLSLAANDFGLSYDVERVPATQLSVADCANAAGAAIAAASAVRARVVWSFFMVLPLHM